MLPAHIGYNKCKSTKKHGYESNFSVIFFADSKKHGNFERNLVIDKHKAMTEKQKNELSADAEILFSRAVKAGKRVYYLDVKSDRRGETYLALTESKRVMRPDSDTAQFEKHKIFIYPEDFDKFKTAFEEVLSYARQHPSRQSEEQQTEAVDPIDLNIEF